eukprot:2037283-Rhodomonas_salina.2
MVLPDHHRRPQGWRGWAPGQPTVCRYARSGTCKAYGDMSPCVLWLYAALRSPVLTRCIMRAPGILRMSSTDLLHHHRVRDILGACVCT